MNVLRPYIVNRLEYVVKCLKYKANPSFCVKFLMKGFCSQHREKAKHQSVKSFCFLFFFFSLIKNGILKRTINKSYKKTEKVNSEMELNNKKIQLLTESTLPISIIWIQELLASSLPISLSTSVYFSPTYPLSLSFSLSLPLTLSVTTFLYLLHALRTSFSIFPPFSTCLVMSADSITPIINVRISIVRKILLPLMNVNQIYRHDFFPISLDYLAQISYIPVFR